MAQTADVVFPVASDASRDPSSTDSGPAVDDDSELKGTIQFPPPNNDSDCGAIR